MGSLPSTQRGDLTGMNRMGPRPPSSPDSYYGDPTPRMGMGAVDGVSNKQAQFMGLPPEMRRQLGQLTPGLERYGPQGTQEYRQAMAMSPEMRHQLGQLTPQLQNWGAQMGSALGPGGGSPPMAPDGGMSNQIRQAMGGMQQGMQDTWPNRMQTWQQNQMAPMMQAPSPSQRYAQEMALRGGANPSIMGTSVPDPSRTGTFGSSNPNLGMTGGGGGWDEFANGGMGGGGGPIRGYPMVGRGGQYQNYNGPYPQSRASLIGI